MCQAPSREAKPSISVDKYCLKYYVQKYSVAASNAEKGSTIPSGGQGEAGSGGGMDRASVVTSYTSSSLI